MPKITIKLLNPERNMAKPLADELIERCIRPAKLEYG
jgi:hypothetical protein